MHVGAQAMMGAGAVLTKDAKPWHPYLAVPVNPVRAKPNALPEAIENA
jgi:acetyltransferase-like isoleucine patch superfamily enzyme